MSSTFAEMFEQVLVPTIFRPWGGELLDRAKPQPGERVLDVGCGTGIVARLVRERTGPATTITGIDLNDEMLGVARSVAPDIAWLAGNATALPFPPGSFDLVVCQQSLQFFPDRPAAAREMHRVLAAGGRLALSTWRPLEENPLFSSLHQLAVKRFGPHPDRRFSLGEAEALRALLTTAGFREIRIETVTHDEAMPDARRFVAINLGAAAPDLDDMEAPARSAAIAAFQAEAAPRLAPFLRGAGIVHPVSANIVLARA